MISQEWEGELERAYVVHRARRVHEDRATQRQAPGSPVPAYLEGRVHRKRQLPYMQVEAGWAWRTHEEEEEMEMIVAYVVRDLAPELFIELMAGFHK